MKSIPTDRLLLETGMVFVEKVFFIYLPSGYFSQTFCCSWSIMFIFLFAMSCVGGLPFQLMANISKLRFHKTGTWQTDFIVFLACIHLSFSLISLFRVQMRHGVIYVLPTPVLSTSKQSLKPERKKNGRRDSASRDEMSPPTLCKYSRNSLLSVMYSDESHHPRGPRGSQLGREKRPEGSFKAWELRGRQ